MSKNTLPKIYLYKQIVEAKLYIDSNYDQSINLDQIAHHAYFSKFHFHRIFKECYGKTPLEYLTCLRIRKAKNMLSANYSIQDVCSFVGYTSVSSFSKLFKRCEGITPAQFSQIAQARKQDSMSRPLNHIPKGFAEYLGWNNI